MVTKNSHHTQDLNKLYHKNTQNQTVGILEGKGVAYVNYLKQILAINQQQLINPLSAGQFILLYALMNVNNDCAWKEWFTVANSRLELFTQLSEAGIKKARNELSQKGYIEFKTNHGKATSYKIIKQYNDVAPSTAPSTAPSSAPSSALNKEKESNLNESKSNNISAKLLENQFNALWDIYPRKERKNDAFKAYIKAIKKGVEHTKIQNGLKSYIEYVKANQTETKYIKQGGTWFNQECWNDEYTIDSNPKTNYSNYPTKAKGYIEPLPDWLFRQQNEERAQRGVN